MARKQFNYILAADTVTVQRLEYPEIDGDAVVAEELTFGTADVPATIVNGEGEVSLASYGLSQILQDRVSSVAGDGKLAKMQEVMDMLKEGKWKESRATGTGERKATIDSFFATGFALFLQSKGKDVDANAATVLLQGMEAEERKALRAHDGIKPFIQKAKDQANATADSLDLAELLG